MNETNRTGEVYSDVSARLEGAPADLWLTIRNELQENGGPDAAYTYLESELQQLTGIVLRDLAALRPSE